MITLERAIILAATYHATARDKMGKPYILHPLRVMTSLGLDATDTERMVAVLHDAIEDTELTLDDLREEGLSEEACIALDLLSKKPGYDEDTYFNNIADNPIARAVKIADLKDNMDYNRLKNKRNLQEKDLQRFANYVKRWLQLSGA